MLQRIGNTCFFLDKLRQLFYRTTTAMNIRLVTVIIFVLIITGGLIIFFMNEQNTSRLSSVISPTSASESADMSSDNRITERSYDNRVAFSYPESWYSMDVTPGSGRGEFGRIMQTLVLQSYPVASVSAGGAFPENAARITIEIQEGGRNLAIEELVECAGKTVTCEKVGIDNQQFIRSEGVLNTGLTTIVVATFYDDNVLRASALVSPGQEQEMYLRIVNDILNSFQFSDNAPVRD